MQVSAHMLTANKSLQIKPGNAGRPGSVNVIESSLISKRKRSASSVSRRGFVFNFRQREEVMGARQRQQDCSLQRH